jgi:hypothetical protein
MICPVCETKMIVEHEISGHTTWICEKCHYACRVTTSMIVEIRRKGRTMRLSDLRPGRVVVAACPIADNHGMLADEGDRLTIKTVTPTSFHPIEVVSERRNKSFLVGLCEIADRKR